MHSNKPVTPEEVFTELETYFKDNENIATYLEHRFQDRLKGSIFKVVAYSDSHKKEILLKIL
jgi:hypothetical protein